MSKAMKLTPSRLKQIIAEERKKLEDAGLLTKTAKEVDAKDYAKALVNKIDYVKKLGIQESKLKRKLFLIQKLKNKVSK